MIRRLGVSLIVLLTAACATVGNGPMQRIAVDSNPAGARVRLYNCGAMATKTATTPAVVWVSRRSTQCRLRVSLPGEEERVVRLVRHVSRNMKGYSEVANGIWGPNGPVYDGVDDFFYVGIVSAAVIVPSVAVDAATGSMFELAPSRVRVDFARPPE